MSGSEGTTADSVLKLLEEQHNKYKYMEYNLSTKKNRCCIFYNLIGHILLLSTIFFINCRLKSQIPELKSSLNLINYLETIKACFVSS